MTKRNDQWEVDFTVFPAVLSESPMAMVIPIKIAFRDSDNQPRPFNEEEDGQAFYDDSQCIGEILGGELVSGGYSDPQPRIGVQGEAYLIFYQGGPINAEILKAATRATARGVPQNVGKRHVFAPGQKDTLTIRGRAVQANSNLHPVELLESAQAMRTSEEPLEPSAEVEDMIRAALDTARFKDEMRQAETAPTVKVTLKKGPEWEEVHHCAVHTYIEMDEEDDAEIYVCFGRDKPAKEQEGWGPGPMLQVESGLTLWSRRAA